MIELSKKTCLLGEFAVGKTSLVRRFVHSLFDDRYLSTVGVKVSRKVVVVPCADRTIRLTMMLWDLAGDLDFSQLRSSYLRGAAGALLVCDLTRPDTLDSLHLYAADMRTTNPESRLVIAANKSDLWAGHETDGSGPMMATEQIEAIANELGASWTTTSALTGEGVEEAFRQLANRLVC